MESAWACTERPRLAKRHEPSGQERVAAMFSIGGAEEGVDITLGGPVLVGVALTAEAAEAWKAEPAEGVVREIGALPLVGRIKITDPLAVEIVARWLALKPADPILLCFKCAAELGIGPGPQAPPLSPAYAAPPSCTCGVLDRCRVHPP